MALWNTYQVLVCCFLSTSWTVSESFGSHPLRRNQRSLVMSSGRSPGGWGAAPAGRWTAVGSAGSSRPPGCCTTWPCLNTPGRAAGFPASSDPWPAQMHSRTQVGVTSKFHGFMIMCSLWYLFQTLTKKIPWATSNMCPHIFLKGHAWIFPEHSLISHEHLPKNKTPITLFFILTEKQPVCNFGPILDPWITAPPTCEADLIKRTSLPTSVTFRIFFFKILVFKVKLLITVCWWNFLNWSGNLVTKNLIWNKISYLNGVDQSHESQAAEVHVQGVAQRPHQIVPWRFLANVAHVDHGGSTWFTGRLAVSERGTVGGEVVRVVVHVSTLTRRAAQLFVRCSCWEGGSWLLERLIKASEVGGERQRTEGQELSH